MRNVLLLSLVFVLGACEQADPQPQVTARPASLDQALSSMTFARSAGSTAQENLKVARAALGATVGVADQAADWREASALAEQAVEQAESGAVRSAIEQSTAKLLLVGYLIPSADQEGTASTALDYSRTLVERQSPEADVVLASVEAFGSQWNPAEMRAVALGAADAAEAYVANTRSCPDCEIPEAGRQDLSGRGQTMDVANARRLDAARQLRAIAE